MKTFVFPVAITFGDCDPAGIVYYPNFFRWFDAASHAMWRAVGHDFQDFERAHGLITGPLVDAGARFVAPATHGESVAVHSSISAWTGKTFRVSHRIQRGDTLIAEGWEVRIFGQADPTDAARLRAVPIPAAFRQRFD